MTMSSFSLVGVPDRGLKNGILSAQHQRHLENEMFDGGLPYNPFRIKLYTVAELMHGYDGKDANTTLDAAICKFYADHGGNSPKANVALGQRIHDHAIDVALDKLVKGLRIVGIMGGHSVLRSDPAYTNTARLGKLLTSAMSSP
jgi:hypothetical protein